MKYKEIEFKYRADGVSLAQFCKEQLDSKPKNHFNVSGHDHFYAGPSERSFCRLRIGPDMVQLTFKSPDSDKNNFIRTEVNVTLAPDTKKEAIDALMTGFGYTYNNTIFKTCFIFEFPQYIMSYYTVYDTNMTESGRFIEVELDESEDWESQEYAWAILRQLERNLTEDFGLTAQHRVKKSLFELYKK